MLENKKTKYKDYFKPKKEINLYSVNYQSKDDIIIKIDKVQLAIDDRIRIVNTTLESICYRIIRTVHFIPDSLFEISISLECKAYYKEKVKSLSVEEVKKIIKDDTNQFVSSALHYISGIISSLTSIGGPPLITPPIIEDKEVIVE